MDMAGNLPVVPVGPGHEDGLRPGKWWHREEDRIVCDLCPRRCVLSNGDRGFCFVRQNIDDRMMLTTYGRSTGFCVDPIEKKPLNHFFPGTSVLSFGTAGCNLGCKFCQNWDISKSREVERLSERAMPEDIASAAKALGCRSVAFTYNDPVIWAEYAIETAAACRAADVKTVAVTAGYITPEARRPFFDAMDAANVDLKGFTEEFYYRVTLSHLEPVLDTLRWLKQETDVWFEITNLVIPDANDNSDEILRLCEWVLENVGDEVPVHFSAFHPDFRMRDRPNTPAETLIAARETALATGLKHVYTGNVDDVTRQSTYCPGCGGVVIERNWYELGTYALEGNHCAHCGQQISGHFETRPGTWGRRRLPVDMRRFISKSTDRPPAGLRAGELSQANPMKTEPSQESVATADATAASTAASEFALDDQQKQQLFAAAGEFVTATVLGRRHRVADEDVAEIGRQSVAGVFVSLKRKGHLRSCCGTFGQMMPLLQALETAAVRTATEDPRFPRISPIELSHLELEVWLLSKPEQVADRGESRVGSVVIGTHGLQVVRGNQRGLLLPGVAVDNNWNAEEFLNQTCLKAGLPPTSWKEEETILFRFEGTAIRGEFPAGDDAEVLQSRSLLDAADFDAYLAHCQGVVEALMSGSTPLYYCTTASDANVAGIAVTASRRESNLQLTAFRLAANRGLPLQATLFALCEEIVQALRRQRVPSGEFSLDIAIVQNPALHGSVADPDLAGVNPVERALLVMEGNKTALVFNAEQSVEELLREAVEKAGVVDPTRAQVLSLAIRSTRPTETISSAPSAVSGPEVRPAAVAGTFYPADAVEMSRMLDELFEGEASRRECSAAMVPHAGWRFSGRIAADVLKQVEFPSTAIVIGPKHTPHGAEWAVAPHASWSLPNGQVDSDPELARALAAAIPQLELDASAHQAEHGIEVELPLVARVAPGTRVVGIAIGGGDINRCEQFAEGLAGVIRQLPQRPLLIISTDMNHFANDSETRRLDELALAELDRIDADALYRTVTRNHISMCGMLPAVIVLKTLGRLGDLSEFQRVTYGTSADVTGDRSRVVGYAGGLFC